VLLLLTFEEKIPHLGTNLRGVDFPFGVFFVKESSNSLIWVLQEIFHVTQDVHTTVAEIVLHRNASGSHAAGYTSDLEALLVLCFLKEIVL
jgi:hypothetical protein